MIAQVHHGNVRHSNAREIFSCVALAVFLFLPALSMAQSYANVAVSISGKPVPNAQITVCAGWADVLVQNTQQTCNGALPLNAPASPNIVAVTASNPPAGTYEVETTYVNSSGETVGSAAASITTTGGALGIYVPSPASYSNATGWNVYFTTIGENSLFYEQNSTPIALGTAYTQSAAISTTGNQPPAVTTATASILPISPIYSNSEQTRTLVNPFNSDTNGRYTFFAPAGEYTVSVASPGYVTYSFPVSMGTGSYAARLQGTGTTLTFSDFSNPASTGWGTGATISGITGTDTGFNFTITAGTSPSLDPYTTLTFHDGPWSSIQSIIANWGSGGAASDILTTNTLSSVTMTYLGLPIAGQSYRMGVVVIGQSNATSFPPALNPVIQNPNAAQTTGNQSITIPFAPNINNILTVDGITYLNLNAAFPACPNTGCTIDMRGNSSPAALNLATFDPGTTPVTILLGPYSYTLTQMTVRNNLHVVGVLGTTITQASASTAPFVLPTTGSLISVNVSMQDFQLQAAAGSTTNGISMVAAAGGGLYYSSFENITIGTGAPFGGNAIRLDSSAGGSPQPTDQFLWFKRITAFRGKNAPPVLRISGPYSGQITFQTTEFDEGLGYGNDTVASCNIQIDDGNSTVWLPYSLLFNNVTVQNATFAGSAAFCFGGVENVEVIDGHFENDNGVAIAAFTGHHGNYGIVFEGSYLAATVGVNGGSGFITNTDASSQIVFRDAVFNATPNAFYIGSSNQFVSAYENINASNGSWMGEKEITYTCSTLPAAATVGTTKGFLVTDATTYTPGPCVGGGSDAMIAVSNGTVWSVH
jgi:hypothetical protein